MSNLRIEKIVVSHLEQNCRLIINGDQCLIVDPGYDKDKIIKRIEELKVKPQGILITHGHFDHIGNAQAIKDHFTISTYGPHIADRPYMLLAEKYAMDKYGLSGYQNLDSDNYLNDGQILNLIGLEFVIEHTPGHSRGHVIFKEHKHRFVLVGDLVFRGSIGRTDLETSEPEKIGPAIKRSILSLADDFLLYTGHREDTTVGFERVNNGYLLEFAQLD